MRTKLVLGALAVTLGCAATRSARAEEMPLLPEEGEHIDYFSQQIPAPWNAFELSLGSGYTQGFGMLHGGVGMPTVATPGLMFDAGAGYRLDPRWGFAVTGQFQELTAERATSARGLATGVAAAYHFSPYRTTAPWVQLGTGYRMLWESQAGAQTRLTHGFELGKATVGVDFHLVDGATLGPMLGADLDLFLWESGNAGGVIAEPRLSTFVFAGLQARLDLTGKLVNAPPPHLAR